MTNIGAFKHTYAQQSLTIGKQYCLIFRMDNRITGSLIVRKRTLTLLSFLLNWKKRMWTGYLDPNLQGLALVIQRSQKIFQHFRQKDIYLGVDLGTNDVGMIKLDLVNLSTNCYRILSTKLGGLQLWHR